MRFLPYNLHTHTHTHTHTISGICRITTINLTIYQTTLFTACLISLITYMHTQHNACVDVLPKNTLAWMPYYTYHKHTHIHHYVSTDEFSNHSVVWINTSVIMALTSTYVSCVIRLLWSLYALLQTSQTQGRSPIWIGLCLLRLIQWLNALLHTSQT